MTGDLSWAFPRGERGALADLPAAGLFARAAAGDTAVTDDTAAFADLRLQDGN